MVYSSVDLMRILSDRMSRGCVACFLILSLLCLAGLDMAICFGSDGHIGVKTGVGGCCGTGEHEGASSHPVDPADPHQTEVGEAEAEGEQDCEDIPLLRLVPTPRLADLSAAPPAAAAAAHLSLSPEPSAHATRAVSLPDSRLCRLRSIVLLV